MTTSQFLLQVLDELSEDEFERFKFHLEDSNDFEPIARGLLEKKARVDVAFLLQKHYSRQARTISRDILLKLPRQDLLERMFGKGDSSHSQARRKRQRPEGRDSSGIAPDCSENEKSPSKKSKAEPKILTDQTLIALAQAMGHSWKQIGIQFLELQSYEIERCESQELTVVMQRFEMLKSWRNREKEKATAHNLHSILSNRECPISSAQLDCLRKDIH
ncbi:uncharacterized protein LOC144491338 [Mustelus asterias]